MRRFARERRACLAVAYVLIALMLLTGTAAAQQPIRIGLAQPLTGPVAAAGIAVRDGAVIAVDEINAAGGIHGRPIELIIEDTANDPAQCTSVANKLINRDRVVAMIGAWGSSCTLAVVPVVRRYQVPLVVDTASSYKVTDINEEGNDWTFRLSPPSRIEAWALRDVLVEELGLKKVFFLGVNNDWGRGAVVEFAPRVTAAGGEVVGDEYFADTEVDFRAVLSRVAASDADSVIISTDAPQIALILEQLHTLGLDLKVLSTAGSNFPPKIIHLAGLEPVVGTYHTVFFPGVWDPDLSANPEATRRFLAEWERRGHEFIELGEAGRGYDAVYTLAAAIESLDPNNINRASIREALEKVELQGVMYGNIKFREEFLNMKNQHAPPVYVGKVLEDGNLEFVYRPDY